VPEPVRQRLYGVVQVADPLPGQDQVLGAGAALPYHVVGRAGGEALEADDDRPLDVLVDRVDLVDRDAQRLGQFLRGRRPAQRGGQPLLYGLDLARPAAYRPAGPVQAAQLVQQRTADPGRGEAPERDAALRVVPLGGRGERGHSRGYQVVAADVRGQPA